MALLAESELWPNLIHEAHARGIPLAMLNARLSPRSYARWLKAPSLIGAMLGRMDLVLAQTQDDALRLSSLGAPSVKVCGNLKYDTPAPPADPEQLALLRGAIGSRPVWLAASTHPGEEISIAAVHQLVAPYAPGLLTIVAPRHAQRGAEVLGIAQRRGIASAQRSLGHSIDAQTGFYVADTMGELGLFYRLARIVFVGTSIDGQHGGQNPIEPAKLGAMVLHGASVANFAEVYQALDEAGGAFEVADAEALADAVRSLLASPAQLRKITRAASEAVEKFTGAANATMAALDPWLVQMQVEAG